MTEPTETSGNYEFLGIIDKPKAGVTYKVRNLTTGEVEALRMLPGASYGDPESLQRFLREIKIHTRLSHPNIIAFHDALELDGQLVMTAEFVEGASLSDLCRRGKLTSPETIRVICDVLSGLEEAHALGIVHRSITSDHVMVARDGQVKLGGFGLAKPVGDVGLTQAGAVLGDPRYMSPEQVMAAGPLDDRADVYSVGVVLFEALTGRVPFDGANDFDIMVAQVDGSPPRPSSLNPGIAPEVERIVLTALSKDRDQRFSSAREFRLALAALNGPIAVPEVVEQPALATVPAWALAAEPVKPSRLPFVLGLAGVAFGVVILLKLVAL